MEKKNTKKHSIFECICFMINTAYSNVKSVIVRCILLAVTTVIYEVCQLYTAPIILQKVETSSSIKELLITIIVITMILLVVSGLLAYQKENVLYGRIEVRTKIVNKINHKAFTTSYPNMMDANVTKMLNAAMDNCNGNSDPSEKIWTTLTDLLTYILGFIIYMFLLVNVDFYLILVVIVTTIVGFFIDSYINEWGYRHRDEIDGYDKKLYYINRKGEDVKLAKDIKIFSLGGWINSIYDSTLQLANSFIKKREKIYSLTCLIEVILLIVRNGVAYYYLIAKVLDGAISVSQFLLYFNAFTSFTNWINGILDNLMELDKDCLGISKILDYLQLPEQFNFNNGKTIKKADSYQISLENVSFHYPGSDREILKDINLTIEAGQKVAVVGLNGAGKSTLVKLICGFYDPDKGRVLLNGQDIKEFNRNEYYGLFSAVFQDMSIFDLTVAQQVAQRIDGIDIEKVKRCLQKAGLTEKINSLPNGLDTHIGKKVYLDGVELSGGQMQRLMLARALYKDGPILVLDEPTAALDPIAENDIYMKYNEMTKGKTSLFISHRLASTRFCDRILFVEDGMIIEEGTHQQLLDANGQYAKLFHVQARYYQEGSDNNEGKDNF